MSVQECALYGDLVLWLRDRAAELLAEAREDSSFEAEAARLIPPGARLWLQGWLEAVAHGAFAAPDIPF